MTSYERYCRIRDLNNLTDSDVASMAHIGKSTFSDWKSKRSSPSNAKMAKIAKVFKISTDYIYGNVIECQCPECGYPYEPADEQSFLKHKEVHSRWEKLIKKGEIIYTHYVLQEKIKAKNRNIVSDLSSTLEEKYEAQKEVFRCLYSRSIVPEYSELHPNFHDYVAMILNHKKTEKELGEKLFSKFKNEFGVKEGIPEWDTNYHPDQLKTEGQQNIYYLDKEAERIAQEIFENKELRGLFDAAKDVPAESLSKVSEMIKSFKETNPDG